MLILIVSTNLNKCYADICHMMDFLVKEIDFLFCK